ncbi:hypothetical protein QBC35DRAFT_509837 [Podospora australis]|uniref:Uncharacterized protein n=1 Tax=Podospora australis TaxID=1536484 RepID=A0AAN6WLU6_9PEZI|nr:hypothetical protein QBC35DRAFT_509837 [Podospora australis]
MTMKPAYPYLKLLFSVVSFTFLQPCLETLGLPGIAGPIDDPTCAYTCTSTLSSYPLACSTEDHHNDGSGHSHGAFHTTPDCRANDESYLTTLAWCFDTKCSRYNVPRARLETVWEETSTGTVAVPAKWSYTQALERVNETPTRSWMRWE